MPTDDRKPMSAERLAVIKRTVGLSSVARELLREVERLRANIYTGPELKLEPVEAQPEQVCAKPLTTDFAMRLDLRCTLLAGHSGNCQLVFHSPPPPETQPQQVCACGHPLSCHAGEAGGCAACGSHPDDWCDCDVYTPAPPPAAPREGIAHETQGYPSRSNLGTASQLGPPAPCDETHEWHLPVFARNLPAPNQCQHCADYRGAEIAEQAKREEAGE
jgi:hypothetical protein